MSVIDTPPLNRAERRKRETYERLKNATMMLLLEVGYQKLTIKAITDLADLGYGTFYLHFTDKDDIVWHIMKGNIDQMTEVFNERVKDIPFPKREYISWVFIYHSVQHTRPLFLELFGRNGSVAISRHYQDYLAETHARFMQDEFYKYSDDDDDHPPYSVLSQWAAGALFRLMVWWAETPNNHSPQDMADMTYHMFYRQAPPETIKEVDMSLFQDLLI